MGGRRKFASASRPPSVWDVDHLRRELENIDVDWRHGEALLTYLAHHPEVTTWADVNWAALKRRVPQKLPAFLEDAFSVRSTRVASRHDSKDGTTTKVVVELRDGAEVEAVVMRHATLRSTRVTCCVSSQVGCAMACSFCATGTMGDRGDLSRGEIVEQVLIARSLEPSTRNVVFMGMGEPLNNYDSVVGACRLLLDSQYLALRAGRVTVSTVGVVERIRQLGEDEPRVGLALSLHAPDQAKREAIMPAARGHRIDRVLDAVDAHVALRLPLIAKGPLIMVEYILLGGCNDSDADAEALGDLLENRFAGRLMVNLIPYNPTPDLPYDRPTEGRARAFQAILTQRGLLCCVRVTMGSDVAGACGQLLKKKRGAVDIEDAAGGAPAARRRPARAVAAPRGASPSPPPSPSRARRERTAAALALVSVGFAVAAAATASMGG